mgnify:CR=1 FL=1
MTKEYEMVADAFDEWLDMQNLKIWKTNLFHGAIFLCMLKSPAGFCLQGIFNSFKIISAVFRHSLTDGLFSVVFASYAGYKQCE